MHMRPNCALARCSLLTFCVAACQAPGFTLIDGSEARCVIRIDEADYVVPEEYVGNGRVGERHPELGGSAAVVRRGENGRPKIVFDRFVLDSIHARLPFAHDFVFFHECAHIQRQTRDEIEANCHALNEVRRLGLLEAGPGGGTRRVPRAHGPPAAEVRRVGRELLAPDARVRRIARTPA